jgi:hypothetical protein
MEPVFVISVATVIVQINDVQCSLYIGRIRKNDNCVFLGKMSDDLDSIVYVARRAVVRFSRRQSIIKQK